MKYTLSLVLSLIICNSLFSQSLTMNVELEAVDTVTTWPWNWDIVSDGDRLITVNEIGTLNIKTNGEWQNIEIDPNDNRLEPRSVAVDNDGNIWIATLENGLWRYSTDNEFTNYNTTNSSIPTDKLRVLRIHGNSIWMSTSESEGLVLFDIITEESTLFNLDNSPQLKTNGTLDPYIDLEGNVWFDNRECLSIISTDQSWTSEDFRSVLSGANISDIDFITPGTTVISGATGIVKSVNGAYEFILQDNVNDYNAYHQDDNGNEWIHYRRITDSFLMLRSGGNVLEINSDSIEGIPSQVFKMIEHQDTIMMVGLLGNNISKVTFDFTNSTTDTERANINIFPNPANNYIEIEGIKAQDYNFTIYNLSGQQIVNGILNDNQVNLDGIQPGIYLLELIDKNSTQPYYEKFTLVR